MDDLPELQSSDTDESVLDLIDIFKVELKTANVRDKHLDEEAARRQSVG